MLFGLLALTLAGCGDEATLPEQPVVGPDPKLLPLRQTPFPTVQNRPPRAGPPVQSQRHRRSFPIASRCCAMPWRRHRRNQTDVSRGAQFAFQHSDGGKIFTSPTGCLVTVSLSRRHNEDHRAIADLPAGTINHHWSKNGIAAPMVRGST